MSLGNVIGAVATGGLAKKGTVSTDSDTGEGIYNLNATGGAFTFTLPAATGSQERRVFIAGSVTTTNKVTVAVPAGESLNGVTNGTQIIDTSDDIYTAVDTGSGKWEISKSNIAPATVIPPASTDAVGTSGVSTKYAREDHKHPADGVSADAGNSLSVGADGLHFFKEISPAAATSPAVNTTGSGGVAATYARSDHVHAVQTATNTPNTASGNLASTNVQAALVELQGNIDLLNTLNASNYIAGSVNPVAADGVNGEYYLNVTSGDVFGPKAAGSWPVNPVGNAYTQLGLSTVAGSAPTTAGSTGTGTVAARSDHSHPYQGVSADAGNRLTVGADGRHFHKGPWSYATTTNPVAADDVNSGYQVGDWWINTVEASMHVCRNNTAGAAVWQEIQNHVPSQATNPTATDDISKGYIVGSVWVNVVTSEAFVSTVDTFNSAVWEKINAPLASTLTPPASTDAVGTAGVSTKYAREDHKHPAETPSADANNRIFIGSDGLHYSNATATAQSGVDPSATDDVNAGHNIGDLWVNLGAHRMYMCSSNTAGAAKWMEFPNYTATTTDPTVNDDVNAGYWVGHLWYNYTGNTIWVCKSGAAGAAIWDLVKGADPIAGNMNGTLTGEQYFDGRPIYRYTHNLTGVTAGVPIATFSAIPTLQVVRFSGVVRRSDFPTLDHPVSFHNGGTSYNYPFYDSGTTKNLIFVADAGWGGPAAGGVLFMDFVK